MGLFDILRKGFKGGADFSQCRDYQIFLDKIKLKISLPISNVDTMEPPRDINFPFSNADFFKQNCQQERQHIAIPLLTELWSYSTGRAIWSALNLGILSCSLMVKKRPMGKAADRKPLAKAVIDEYEAHYNHAIISAHGQGTNTRIRQEIYEESRLRNTPWSGAEIEQETTLNINKYGYPPLSPAKEVSINGRSWVYYQETKAIVESKDNFYCYPLDELHYLCLRFRYRVDLQEAFARWKAHAQLAERNIMDSVTIVFPQDEGLRRLPC